MYRASRSLIERCYGCPAALLPFPVFSGFRPVALRPTLSSGLPFSSFLIVNDSLLSLLKQFKCQKNFFLIFELTYQNNEKFELQRLYGMLTVSLFSSFTKFKLRNCNQRYDKIEVGKRGKMKSIISPELIFHPAALDETILRRESLPVLGESIVKTQIAAVSNIKLRCPGWDVIRCETIPRQGLLKS